MSFIGMHLGVADVWNLSDCCLSGSILLSRQAVQGRDRTVGLTAQHKILQQSHLKCVKHLDEVSLSYPVDSLILVSASAFLLTGGKYGCKTF